jgi:hypothetical protein
MMTSPESTQRGHPDPRPASLRPAERPGRTLPDALLGVVGGAMVLGALIVLVLGGERDTGSRSTITEAPQLTIVEPADGQILAGRLQVVFTVTEPLRAGPAGWGVDSLHIHASVNGREFMPASADVQRVDASHFRWVLPRVAPGPVRLRLYWSGPDHRPLAAGASETIGVTIQE